MKFSVVIPVYNVEKYIERCLNSILNQTYDNFEVIIVNDGSPDNSQKIIDKFVKKDKRFKSYIKENGGLSDARNYGVKYSKGDYLIFIDSDDYIEVDYFEKVNEVLIKNNDIEVLKTKLILVDDDKNEIRKEKGLNVNDYVTFKELCTLEFLEPAWSYVYNLSFFKKNKFKYAKGMVHEDFGLTPEIIIKANKIYYLNYYSYYYVQRENSIMSSNSREKMVKKANDMLLQYDRLITLDLKNISQDNTKIYRSFLANAIILKSKTLKGKDRKEYLEKINERNVITYVLDDTVKRKIKKILLKIYLLFFS